jgi:PhnB protein
MQVQPYLFFQGRCEEALEFYARVIGAKLTGLMRYKDSPEPPPPGMLPPGSENKVMHAAFTVGDSTLMASDGHVSGQPAFKDFSLSIQAADAAAATRMFDALAEGGQVRMPLGKTFFASSFGMVTDRFGLSWMVIVQP